MAQWFEIAFDRLYPVLYGHRGADEALRAAESFAHLFAGRGPVLDLACGGGRHMDAFADAGASMFGLDLSAFLLGRAVEESGQGGHVVQGDMRSLPFRDRAFAGAINMFTSFGYFQDDAENRVVLDEVARVLCDGGVFLLDFANAASVLESPLIRTRREQDGYTIVEARRFEDENRYVAKSVTVEHADENLSLEYEERVRLFTPGELEAMLGAAGFAVEAVFGDYDGGAFDEGDSDRVMFQCSRGERG